MNHCTNCKHFAAKEGMEPRFALCKHPKSEHRESDRMTDWYVCGEGETPPDEVTWCYASSMRRYSCGYEGKLFEPKDEVKA